MNKLEGVTAEQLTSNEQYNAFDEAINNGSASEEGGYLRYSAHAHRGSSLESFQGHALWREYSGSASWVYYPYKAGSPIPGSIAIESGVLSYTKVYQNDYGTGFGIRPCYAKVTTLCNGLLCAVLPADYRVSDYFAGIVLQFPNSSRYGTRPSGGWGFYASIGATFRDVSGPFSFNSLISLHTISTTGNAIRTYSYKVSVSGTGNVPAFITDLVLPEPPVVCKVAVWRAFDDNPDDIKLSSFQFMIPFGVF